MNEVSLLVDGMLSGTGIRDAVNGGYVEHADVPVPPDLSVRINSWLADYEELYYHNFDDKDKADALDAQGIDIAKRLEDILENTKIGYYSSALVKRLM